MPNYRGGYLEQGAPVGATRKDVLLSADNQIIDCDDISAVYLQSDNATATNRTFTLKDGAMFGHRIAIFFVSGSSFTCDLQSSGNVKLTAAWAPLQYDSLSLMWDGIFWTEIGRGYSGSRITDSMLAVPETVGLKASRTAHGIYNSASGFGVGARTVGVTIPINAFVTGAWYWVKTTFTSANSTATLAIHLQAANDIVSAVILTDGGAPWAGTSLPVEGIVKIETTSTWLRTTVARDLTVTVGTQAITAGVMHLWVDYFVAD